MRRSFPCSPVRGLGFQAASAWAPWAARLGWWAGEGYAIGCVTRRLGDHERVDAIDTAVREVLGRP